VDKDNFETVLPSIKKDIDDASFIALDLELSGISKSSLPSLLSHVNAESYYNLHKDIASRFQILQVGLSAFKEIEGNSNGAKKYLNCCCMSLTRCTICV